MVPDDAHFQAAGFVVGGEPLGVDLADTLITVSDPPTDLLTGTEAVATWWALESGRLPPSAGAASAQATIDLRGALRTLLDAAVAGDPLPGPALAAVNAAVAAAPTSASLGPDGSVVKLWHGEDAGAVALAAVAESVVRLLGSPEPSRLRRCANPACSMLFVATDPRRQFCTQNVCGNRVRVARHYRRHRGEAGRSY